MKRFIVFIALLQIGCAVAQSYWADSLKALLDDAKGERKAELTWQLALEMQEVDMDSAVVLADWSIDQYRALNDLEGELYAMSVKSTLLQVKSLYSEVAILRKLMITKAKQTGNDSTHASCYCYTGEAFAFSNEFDSAMKYTLTCIELAEALNSKPILGDAYNNLGSIYDYQGRSEEALKAYKKALAYFDRQDYNQILALINNIAVTYDNMEDGLVYLDSAQKYFKEALFISQELDYRFAQSVILGSMGGVHNKLQQFDSALYYTDSSYNLGVQINSEARIAGCLGNYGNIYSSMGQFAKAEENYKRAMELYTELEDINSLKIVTSMLSEMYRDWGKYEEAYNYYVQYKELSDSILNQSIVDAQAEMEGKYQFEKQQRQIEMAESREKLAQAMAEKRAAESEKKSFYLIGAGIVGVLLIIGIGFVVASNRKVKKANITISEQKSVVEQQKELVEEKNKEITDSIAYAKRIQNAILPPPALVASALPDSFVLYKPKDIVAGDFYWIEQQADRIFFAAADCTGHGVPGAMVSVICNNALNRSVREFGLKTPGQILDKTRELVIREFEKSEEEVKDGMDIALCTLPPLDKPITQDDKALLHFAGANNPLWIIKPGADTIHEVKPDKQPIGKYSEAKPFTTHEILAEKGDTIYVFSDGFADQFGGQKGKKLKAANFKKILLEIQEKPMAEQRAILDNRFEEWRGEFEQLDDVCVIGVRV